MRVASIISAGALAMLATASPLRRTDPSLAKRAEAADYIYPIPPSVAPEKRAEAADYIYPIPASVAPEERAEAADYIYPIPASVVPEEE